MTGWGLLGAFCAAAAFPRTLLQVIVGVAAAWYSFKVAVAAFLLVHDTFFYDAGFR